MQSLKPRDFYGDKHKAIYEAILYLDESNGVNVISVLERLRALGKDKEIGGFEYLTNCADMCLSPDTPEGQISIVKEKSLRRQLYNVAARVTNVAKDETIPVDEAISQIEGAVFSVRKPSSDSNSPVKWAASVREEAALAGIGIERRRVRTGLPELDKHLRMYPGGITIMAGDVGNGKSTTAGVFVVNSVLHMQTPQRCCVWLGEAEKGEFYERLFAKEKKIPYGQIQDRLLSNAELAELDKLAAQLEASPLTVWDKPMTVSEIWANCRYIANTQGQIDFLLIDYLTLLKDLNGEAEGGDRRDVRIGIVLWNIMQICKELGCHAIILHQFSRKKSERDTGRPRISDLKESSFIEQHAHNVLLLYRPDCDEALIAEEKEKYAGWFEINIAKARKGRRGSTWFKFDGDHQDIKTGVPPWPGDKNFPMPGWMTMQKKAEMRKSGYGR